MATGSCPGNTPPRAAHAIEQLTFNRDDHLLFISDLHLEASRPDITKTFLHLISVVTAHQAHHLIAPEKPAPFSITALFILGDFFEVWIGDDYQTELSQTVAVALSALAEQGVSLYFLPGNRDFLLGDEYCAQANMIRLNDPTLLTITDSNGPSTRYALMHGDSLCTLDHAYMAFRRMVRAHDWQTSFLSQPIQARLNLARSIRDKSMAQKKQQTKHSNEGTHVPNNPIMDVDPKSVHEQFAQLSVETIIHGHTHRPAIHHNLGCKHNPMWQRAVLGDWDQQGWSLLLHDNQLLLHAFPLIDTQKS